MLDILDRLEAYNEFCETCDSRQLRKDAAEEIRNLRMALQAVIESAIELREGQ